MKILSRCIAAASIVAMSQMAMAPARAWGVEGHKIIAAIALQHLDPVTRKKAERLLQAANLPDFVEVAPWADQYRGQNRSSGPWHFVDIPRSASTYDPDRDCRTDKSGQENCVVAKINQFSNELEDSAKIRTAEDRGIALAFLIHLVGDIHQPLHCADDHDHGGNEVKVKFLHSRSDHGRPRNLHAAWDTYFIQDQYGKLSPEDAARFIDTGIPEDPIAEFGGQKVLDVSQWANESHRIAVKYAWNLPAGVEPELDGAYEFAAQAMIENRLAYAGRRLAALITADLRNSK